MRNVGARSGAAHQINIHATHLLANPKTDVGVGIVHLGFYPHLRRWVSAVESFERGGVTGENRAHPLLEGSEVGGRRCWRGGLRPTSARDGHRERDHVYELACAIHLDSFTHLYSSRRWRPVSRTNTSSKLACRV